MHRYCYTDMTFRCLYAVLSVPVKNEKLFTLMSVSSQNRGETVAHCTVKVSAIRVGRSILRPVYTPH